MASFAAKLDNINDFGLQIDEAEQKPQSTTDQLNYVAPDLGFKLEESELDDQPVKDTDASDFMLNDL